MQYLVSVYKYLMNKFRKRVQMRLNKFALKIVFKSITNFYHYLIGNINFLNLTNMFNLTVDFRILMFVDYAVFKSILSNLYLF